MPLELTSFPKLTSEKDHNHATRTINDPPERGHLTGCNAELPESSEISAHHVKCSLQCKWTSGQGMYGRSI